MKKTVVVLLTVALLSVSSMAGVIAGVDSNYVVEDLGNYGYAVSTDDTNWASRWTTDAAVEYASLDISSSLSLPGSLAYNQYSAVGWDVDGQYFSMTITLADGYVFGDDVELIYGGLRSSSSGPSSGYTAVIVDGVETVVNSYSLSTSYLNSIDDVSSLLEGASSVEIRWYATGATSSSGTYRIGDYYSSGDYTDAGLYGTIVAIPEPATMALLGLGSLVLARRKK